MKKVLFRSEHWLLIIPILLTFIEWHFYPEAAFDIHLHDTYFIIANFHVCIFLLFVVLLPYLCHVFLRNTNKRNKIIPVTHIVLTSLLLIAMPLLIQLPQGSPRRYYDFSNWESFKQFENLNYYLAIITIAFIIIQILFVLYAMVRLAIKR
jgi:cytochrome c oxidase subunit 1